MQENNKFLSREKTQALIDGLKVKKEEGKDFLQGLADKGYTIEGYNDKPVEQPKPTGFLDRVKTDLSKRGQNIVEEVQRPTAFPQPGTKIIRTAGQLAGGVNDIIGEGITSVASGVNDLTGGALGEVASNVGKSIIDTPLGQEGLELAKQGFEKYSTWKQSNPDAAKDLEAVANIASLIPTSKIASLAGSGITTGAKKSIKVVGDVVDSTVDAVKPLKEGTKEVIKSSARSISQIPKNIATNVGEMQATEQLIKTLPKVTAQKAARNGIDFVDVKSLDGLVNSVESKSLIDAVKSFSAGTSKVDPINIVGKPITQKLKALNNQAKIVGERLGKEADNLGILDNEAVQNSVLGRLQKVSGLKGLKLAEDGTLDFGNTTIKSSFTAGDRQAIETAFKEAVDSGSGKQAHMFRQELFEVLDGKKRSLANITDTQDKALNAIRAGLSDVLETNNPLYKTLSNEYRKLVQPMSDLRKLSKTLDPNNAQDILDLSGGLLARRLTGAGASNPQVRMVLQSLDNATKVKGSTLADTAKMQDLYNILNKYYDIAPKTGFQNLVKEGTNSASGLVDTAVSAVKGFAGKTNAVRQKALEDYIDDLLTKTSKTKK